jgi:hypothetical protein
MLKTLDIEVIVIYIYEINKMYIFIINTSS